MQDKQWRATQREIINIAKRRSLLGSPVFEDSKKVDPLDDRRRWRPDRGIPLRVDGRFATYTLRKPKRSTKRDLTIHRIGFYDPKRVMVCKRRKKRREELFKRGKIGKGRSVSRFRRMSEFSDVRC